MNIIDEIEQEQIKEISQKRNVPEFGPGDTLKIHLKVLEGNRERIQEAQRRGIVDEGTDNLAAATEKADLVILCTPVQSIVSKVRDLLPVLVSDAER